MGWGTRLVIGLGGVALLGLGLWPIGLLCFFFLLVSLRPKRPITSQENRRALSPRSRRAVAAVLLGLSAVALGSGGLLSPVVFIAAGAIIAFSPKLVMFLTSEYVPVKDSILLRARLLPFAWCALAEIKPGTEPLPRAVSSFTGTLLVYTDSGRAFAVVTCVASRQDEATMKILSRLKLSARAADCYLFPLGADSSAEVLRRRLSNVKLPAGDLAESASMTPGVLSLTCDKGVVKSASAHEVVGSTPNARLPGPGTQYQGSPLLWEVLDTLGKRTRWPDPDSLSNFLGSMLATRGTPLSERMRTMNGAEAGVAVQSLSGEEIHLSRPQLRAILAVYS